MTAAGNPQDVAAGGQLVGATSEPTCAPEWCETGQEPHSDVCDNGPMEAMSKRQFVDAMEAAAEHAIDAYTFMRLDEWNHDEAKEQAVSEVNEAATCRAGIGSCGRGWCHHG